MTVAPWWKFIKSIRQIQAIKRYDNENGFRPENRGIFGQ
jgi:hypothetical protein